LGLINIMGLVKYLGNLDLENDIVHQLIFGGICISAVVLSTAVSPMLYNLTNRENLQVNTQTIEQVESNCNLHPQDSISSNYKR